MTNQFKKKEEPVLEKKKKSRSGNKAVKTVSNVLTGNFLTKENFVNQLPYLIFLTILGIFYIANTYYAEKTIRKINITTSELKELRSEYITTSSDLMTMSKQSQVAAATAEMGLKESVVPPKKIIQKSKD
jgi:hypothetical protein